MFIIHHAHHSQIEDQLLVPIDINPNSKVYWMQQTTSKEQEIIKIKVREGEKVDEREEVSTSKFT